MISRLQAPDGHVLIPGFYDRVRDLSPDERHDLARIPFDREAWLEEAGVDFDSPGLHVRQDLDQGLFELPVYRIHFLILDRCPEPAGQP